MYLCAHFRLVLLMGSFLTHGSQEDNDGIALACQAGDFKTGTYAPHVRHDKVGNNYGRVMLQICLEPLDTIGGGINGEPVFTEGVGKDLQKEGIIINNEYGFRIWHGKPRA